MVHSTSCPCVLVWHGRTEWTVGDSGREDKTRCCHRKGPHIKQLNTEVVESIAPMPTACFRPAVLSLPLCLTVVGGEDQHGTHLSNVEIFLPHTSQWHKTTSPAPSPLYNMTTTVIDNKCFIAEYSSTKVYQLCMSLQQTTTDSTNTPQVITEWTNLCDLPHSVCGLGSINGCLLAVGGGVWPNYITTILGFSPITNSWKTVGELPETRRLYTTVLLPTGELLVMGGRDGPGPLTNKVWRAAIV